VLILRPYAPSHSAPAVLILRPYAPSHSAPAVLKLLPLRGKSFPAPRGGQCVAILTRRP